MLCLVWVLWGTSVGLVTSFGDSVDDYQETTEFYRRDFRRPKFLDVYTNFPDKETVEESFNQNYNVRSKNRDTRKNSDSPIDRKDTLSFQILDDLFSSPSQGALESEYGHIEPNVFHDSDESNRRPENFQDKYYDNDDRNNFYYPQSRPFLTKNKHQSLQDEDNKFFQDKDKNEFVFLQSQIAIPDSENFGSFYPPADFNSELDYTQNPSRPNFLTTRSNFTTGSQKFQSTGNNVNKTTRRYSHVQKIPLFKKRSTTVSPEPSGSEDSNRYEEIDLSQSHKLTGKNSKSPNTRKQIGDLLRKYLTTVFIENYADKKADQVEPIMDSSIGFKNQRDVQLSRPNISVPPRHQKVDLESKFFTSGSLWDLKNKTISKIKNLFSIFTVIKFNNTECNATNWAGTWQGVCYTSVECNDMNGTALGNCASGYGVCCVFRGTCDDSSSRNCSYFKSPNYPDFYPANGSVITPTTTTMAPATTFPTPDPRLQWYYHNSDYGDEELDNLMRGRQASALTMSCTFSIFKSDPAVNQIRIDFIDLDLASPTNGTCTTERLVITGQNANDQIPDICGYNTGQHVYVDVSQLDQPLQIMVLSTTNARKRFKLRICQYTDSCSTSQSNCLQYYTGVSGVIQSFNYDQADMFNRSSPGYFNNLNYAICIRREAGYCSITYMNIRNGQTYPFQLVNQYSTGEVTVPPGQAGVDIINCPDEYIIIDGTRLCGDRFNDGSTLMNFTMDAPVIDSSAGPIVVNVRTNNNVTSLGFKLFYRQNPCPTADN